MRDLVHRARRYKHRRLLKGRRKTTNVFSPSLQVKVSQPFSAMNVISYWSTSKVPKCYFLLSSWMKHFLLLMKISSPGKLCASSVSGLSRSRSHHWQCLNPLPLQPSPRHFSSEVIRSGNNLLWRPTRKGCLLFRNPWIKNDWTLLLVFLK